MHERAVQISVLGAALLALSSPVGLGQAGFETQVKTVRVVDANGAPVPDAQVYHNQCLEWGDGEQRVRPVRRRAWTNTDAKGVFSFEFVRQGAGRCYFITDAAFERMGCLYIARKDPAETYEVQLTKLARIKGAVRSAHVGVSDIRIRFDYHRPERRSSWWLFAGDYQFESPVHEVPLDLLCPAGCHLTLHVEPEGPALRRHLDFVEIAPLKPGQVLDIGAIELRPRSGYKALGKPAIELKVGEWVKGEPVTLAELRGKVVLLHFWARWFGPSPTAMPELVELHKKYARDGLVVIALHDASQSRADLLDENEPSVDLSAIPFRVAIDAMPQDVGDADLRGRGGTIDAYGVTDFPTTLLVDRTGQVRPPELRAVASAEEDIYLALYGRPMPKPTTLIGRLLATNRGTFAKIGIAAGLILLLLIVLALLGLRQSRIETREP
jgi:thiol-disulfide isomerase/thioredoxin